MACDTERAAVEQAMLALSTSIQSVTQQLAVVQANMLSLQNAQANLALCESNQNPPNPPGP